MDEVKQYKTAGAFRTALETRLQTRAVDSHSSIVGFRADARAMRLGEKRRSLSFVSRHDDRGVRNLQQDA